VSLELTVLLPCLDEAETVGSCVEKALKSLRDLEIEGEVLVSDNGSTDGSQEIARRAGARVMTAPERGYGAALRAGIENARGRYVIMADSDDSYDLADLGPFLAALREGYDVVVGNRFRGGIADGAMPGLHRYLGNPALSLLGRRLFGLRDVGDFHCGIRGFDRRRILALGLSMPGMEFASELLVRAALAGYRVTEVPTTLSRDGRITRPSHLRTWRDGWRHLRFLLVFAPDKTLVFPGAAIAIVSLVGAVLLVIGPRSIGQLTFDINALVYACFGVLLGVQMVLLGGLATLYGLVQGIADPLRLKPLLSLLRFEPSVIVGTTLVLLGFVGSIAAITHWGRVGFGELDPRGTIRAVVPSATLIALGALWLFTGLAGSLITFGRRPRRAEGAELATAGPVVDPSGEFVEKT
jgi:glycosyltransferase involved in cell wall biosynthesis